MDTRQIGRRGFLKMAGVATMGFGEVWALSSCRSESGEGTTKAAGPQRHFVTLSFDDGFKRSSIRTAEIYEKYGLSACINIVASAHLDTFVPPNEGMMGVEYGDFGLWNELKARGHEIMPHSWEHAHLAQMPLKEAQARVTKCLDYFRDNLKGFEAKEAVFVFPYNASTPELEEWIVTQVLGFRTFGAAINPVPHAGQARLTSVSFGPGYCDDDVERCVQELLARPSGWLVYNTHGLDGEGWGPMRSSYLEGLLERLLAIENAEIVPAGVALRRVNAV